MTEILKKLLDEFNDYYENLELDLDKIEEAKNKYLSKKGLLQQVMIKIKDLPNEEKPSFGKDLNIIKQTITEKLLTLEEKLKSERLKQQLIDESFDINLPADTIRQGRIHPLNIILNKVKTYFGNLGYQVKDGPEVESDDYNFEKMNIPKDHPARGMQDSLYLDPNTLLRTHTSPVQARVMELESNKELKLICPGKVYRKDEEDATHSHQFMQIEGLVLGKNVNFINLKETLLNFLKYLFGSSTQIRIRPSYFPFTEPSIEVDMTYKNKKGELKFIEILGAGMVHPNVLRSSGYDPNKIQGFAFGIGVERIAMLYYKINDIRHFYQNDIRFLKQFKEEN